MPLSRRLALGLLAAFALTAADASAGGGGARQIVTDHWSSRLPGTSAGRTYGVDFVDPANPGGKPPAVGHVRLQLPSGARFDTDAIPRCEATDVQLMLEGAGACPGGSMLGTMQLTFDTGLSGGLRYLNANVTFLNAHAQLIFLAQDPTTGVRTVFRSTVTSQTLESDIPILPGTPPDGAADRRERGTFLARSSARGNYLTTPPTCPPNHQWVERETYTYRDGVTQTVEIPQPCTEPAPRTQPLHSSHHHARHRHRRRRSR